MTVRTRGARAIEDGLRQALTSGALPGELDGFGPEELDQAAAFVAEVAERRQPGKVASSLLAGCSLSSSGAM